jgi:sigma-B regulation protein RsbU (phosphoserine phosphatase)
MAVESIETIEKGLEETRTNLEQWIEETPPAKQELQVCAGDAACVRKHLEVIDQSLEKIHEGSSTVCLGHFSEDELRQLESELELSQVVQRGLLPQRAPSIPGLAVAAFSRPAQIVSGDYFDFVRFRDGAHGIVVADVSGHGVSAGMLMSSLQTAFHTLAPVSDSPLEVLEKINHLYAHNIGFTTFVTMFFAKLDPATRALTYGNAGHTSGYLHRNGGGKEVLLHATGPAIGLMEGFAVRSEELQLEAGDVLVLYTDGVTEGSNPAGEQFGLDRLTQAIDANYASPPEQLIQRILGELSEFTANTPLADDVTVVACRVAE